MNPLAKFVPLPIKRFLWEQIRALQKKVHVAPYLYQVSISAVEHCNLNCKGCSTFSPLAKEELIDVAQLEKDLQELSKKLQIAGLYIIGGEPLLHPAIAEIIAMGRRVYPREKITLTTNGILLPKMSDHFWDTMRSNRARILLSLYPPYKDRLSDFCRLIRQQGVALENIYDRNLKKRWEAMRYSFRATHADIHRIYRACKYKNCIQLYRSKLYICNAFHLKKYNEYFHESQETIRGYDIYQYSGRELQAFMNQPDPCCRYCGWVLKNETIPWDYSKRKKSEWCADVEE